MRGVLSGSKQYFWHVFFQRSNKINLYNNVKGLVNTTSWIKCTMVTGNNNKICFPQNLICIKLEYNVDHTTFILECHPMWILAATKSKHC
jgi:hypothetical protein